VSQGVDKLKELLFDSESAALADLKRRIEAVASSSVEERRAFASELERLAASEAEHRAELGSRLDEVFNRAGTEERFRQSVAEVLDAALRTAEIERHEELSQAVAPLVVRTIKTEIHNSQDELVEALYPITGRMVQSYVASAIKDMMDQINRRLETNPAMLRLRSLTTGKSPAELALAETQHLEVEEIYLIRRGSGELIGRWPQTSASGNRDHVMSGVLTAINEFANEAFAAEGSSLRQIDLGHAQVYLRASPTYLLAAKCSGTAPTSVEQIIDGEVLQTISAIDAAEETGEAGDTLPPLAARLQERINAKQDELRDGTDVSNPLRTVAWVAGIALVCFLSWTLYEAYNSTRVRSIATTIVNMTPEIRGYPTRIRVAPYGTDVTIAGLTPTPQAQDKLITNLRAALGSTRVNDELTVIESALDKTAPRIAELERQITTVRTESSRSIETLREKMERETIARMADRAAKRLRGLDPVVSQLAASAAGSENAAAVSDVAETIDATVGDLERLRAKTQDEPAGQPLDLAALATPMAEIETRLSAAFASLSSVLGSSPQTASADTASPTTTQASIVDRAESLSLQSERLATLAVAVAQAAAVKPATAEKSLREKLEEFARTHAVFFSTGTDYRSTSATDDTLVRLANLIKERNIVVRIVGYTDDRGGNPQNASLSQQRANKVYQDLIKRGVPASQLVAIGRTDLFDLSPIVGADSPNRRVQFEVGFEGELP